MKLTEEQAADLLWEGSAEDDLWAADQENWTNIGKGERARVIFYQRKGPNQGTHFRLTVMRYGSEFTEWHYVYTLECPEVKARKVETTVWDVCK